MSIIILCISVILTMLIPVPAIFLNLLGIIFSRGKVRKTYGLLLAFSLAVVAYMWVPGDSMDLYRHHQQVQLLQNFNTDRLFYYIRTSLEPVHYIVSFVVAQTENYNLLQFLVILIGYFELFWTICDYSENKNIKKGLFALLCVYIISSLRFIDFASGLWCNFAIINIALGVYLDFSKKTRYMQYLLYALAACLHVGTLYIVVLVLLFSKMRIFSKVRLPVVFAVIAAILSFGAFVYFIDNIFGVGSTIATTVHSMYNAYFVNGEQYENLHTDWTLYLSIANAVMGMIFAIIESRKKRFNRYADFVIYLTIGLIATIINAGVFVRYGFLIAILSAPLIGDIFIHEKNKIIKIITTCFILTLASLQLSRSIIQINSVGLLNEIEENSLNNVIYIMDNTGK